MKTWTKECVAKTNLKEIFLSSNRGYGPVNSTRGCYYLGYYFGMSDKKIKFYKEMSTSTTRFWRDIIEWKRKEDRKKCELFICKALDLDG